MNGIRGRLSRLEKLAPHEPDNSPLAMLVNPTDEEIAAMEKRCPIRYDGRPRMLILRLHGKDEPQPKDDLEALQAKVDELQKELDSRRQ